MDGILTVFSVECKTSARRWHAFGLRSLLVLALLFNLSLVWWAQSAVGGFTTVRRQAEAGMVFFLAIACTQLAIVMLAAPAGAAGAICHDKARGALAVVLTTDLSSAEIVVGKLAARLCPAVGLVLCSMPVLALGGLLGGVDPGALLGLFLVTLGCAVGGCTVALALSVLAGTMYEALMATYAVGLVWVSLLPGWLGLNRLWGGGPFAVGPPGWVWRSNPFWLVFAPYASPRGCSLCDAFVFLAGSLATSGLMAGLAAWRLRKNALGPRRTSRRLSRRRTDWLATFASPSLDSNPVLWREWRRRRLARWLSRIIALYGLAALVLSVLVIVQALRARSPMMQGLAAVFNGLQVAGGMLLLSAVAATALAEDRARGDLELLRATPLGPGPIVAGHWCAGFRRMAALAVLPGLVAGVLGCAAGSPWQALVVVGLVLAYGAALVSLGLALALWLPRPSQAGVWCVTLHTLICAGWPFVAIMLNPALGLGPGLAMASPPLGILLATQALGSARVVRLSVGLFGPFWIAAYMLVALALFWASRHALEPIATPGFVFRRLTGWGSRTR